MAATKLSAQFLNRSLKPGRYYDNSGVGLQVYVRKSGSKAFVQRLRFNNKYIDIGLGGYPTISLAEARRMATENKILSAKGIDPRTTKTQPLVVPSFETVAQEYLKIKLKELSNEKHKAQWLSTLEQYAYPALGKMIVSNISTDDVLNALTPIWDNVPETASRTRGRIEAVLNYAIAKKYMPAPNPAAWSGNLKALLPSKNKTTDVEHHPALQLRDAKRWWKELNARDGQGRNALMMLTLTAARSGEIRGMHWQEIYLFEPDEVKSSGFYGIWTIPASRMKTRHEHRLPIIYPMLKILENSPKQEGLVFPSPKGGLLSDMTLSALMKRINLSAGKKFVDHRSKRPAVPHGLRSTFRDWVAENQKSREAAELQLAHKFGSAVEHAYYRSDLLKDRAKLMNEWFNFLAE